MSIDISVRHLRILVAVADAGGYTAAAQQLRISQPSLSRAVRELEQRVGVRLLDRTTRMVVPTRDGEELITLGRRTVEDFDASLRHFQGYLAGNRGAVGIAALPSLAATLLPQVLSEYRRTSPEVRLTVSDGLSAELVDLVSGGMVDMAIAVVETAPPGVRAHPLASDRLFCVMPPGHELARLETVRWRDLTHQPFVAFDSLSSIRALVDRTSLEHGVVLGPVLEARNIAAVAGLVAAGLGVSIAPALVLPTMSFAHLDFRPLTDPVVERSISLLRSVDRPLSAAALALSELLLTADRHDLDLPPGARWAIT